MREPDRLELERIIKAHLQDCDVSEDEISQLIGDFLEGRDKKKHQLATDQLLNAIFMVTRGRDFIGDEKKNLQDRLLSALDSLEGTRRK